MSKDIERIEANWETYNKLLRRLCDNNINEFLESLGERLCMCPASPRLSDYSAHPGGLIEHMVLVTSQMRNLNESLGLQIPVNSIIKTGLLHDIGKVGDLNRPLFYDQDSSWHRENLGQMYKYNDEIQKMSSSHRTLCLLQHFGVKITQDEWIAIQISGGSHFEENRFYVGSEPTLAMLLQKAKAFVIHLEKNPHLKK